MFEPADAWDEGVLASTASVILATGSVIAWRGPVLHANTVCWLGNTLC